MTFEYITTEDAITAKGLRMVVVSGVPSPWGEAAKGILHVKGIPFQAVRLNPRDEDQMKWAKFASGPVAVYNDEAPIKDWQKILNLTERLAPSPSLLPQAPEDKALALELAEMICGQDGLGWWRRIQGIHNSLNGRGGFPLPVGQYLAPKYGYSPENGAAAFKKVKAILGRLTSRLKVAQETGSPYYIGKTLSCVDIYSATFCSLFAPLPPEHCNMRPEMRAAFTATDSASLDIFDPVLTEHRDFIYHTHLELPLSL